MSQFFQDQHERIEALLNAHLLDIVGGDFIQAKEVFTQWRTALDEHIRIENQELLPHVPEGARWAAKVYLLEHERIALLADDYAQRLQLVLTTLLSLLAVVSIKYISSTSCPWDLAEFGGVARYVSHWTLGVVDGGGAHCFPAGHASAGFAFFGGYFVLRDAAPRAARIWLWATLVVGLVLGISQQARGAHFMSHTLWTAWLCWTIAWLCDGAATHLRLRYQAHPATPEARHVAS